MSRGALVPDETIIKVVVARLQENDCKERGWLLDGFPRTAVQAAALKAAGISCDVFINLEVDSDVLIERVVGRRMDPVTGKIYHLKYSPPPADDDELMGRLVYRSDDNEVSAKTRVATFKQNLESTLGHFSDCMVTVDGNRNPKDIGADIVSILSDRQISEVIFILGGPGT